MSRQEALDKLKHKLLDRLSKLSNSLDSTVMEITDEADLLDRSASQSTNEISAATATRETQEIKAIKLALQKMESKSYGACENCSKAIHSDRLAVLPFARFCIVCQRGVEKMEAVESIMLDFEE